MRLRVILALLIIGLVAGLTVTMAQGTRTDPGFQGNRVTPGFSGTGGGPGCTADFTIPAPVTDLPGDSCGFTDTVNSYGGTCTLPFSYGGEDVVYEVTLGASNSVAFILDLTGSAGDLALFLIGTCGDGTSCVANSNDSIGPGAGPETIAETSYPAGTYYAMVDSYYDAGLTGSCGVYSLTAQPTFPVELINFSVE